VYKTVTCVLNYNLLLDPVKNLIEIDDFDIYRNAIAGLEILNLVVMSLVMHYVRMTIKIFDQAEFDLIRNNFTTDFYARVQDTSGDD